MSKDTATENGKQGLSFSVQVEDEHTGYVQFNRKYSLKECNSFIENVVMTGQLSKLVCHKQLAANGKAKLKFCFPKSSRPVFWLQGMDHPLVTKRQLIKGEVNLTLAEETQSMDEEMSKLFA